MGVAAVGPVQDVWRGRPAVVVTWRISCVAVRFAGSLPEGQTSDPPILPLLTAGGCSQRKRVGRMWSAGSESTTAVTHCRRRLWQVLLGVSLACRVQCA
jgi:hypothetical protein